MNRCRCLRPGKATRSLSATTRANEGLRLAHICHITQLTETKPHIHIAAQSILFKAIGASLPICAASYHSSRSHNRRAPACGELRHHPIAHNQFWEWANVHTTYRIIIVNKKESRMHKARAGITLKQFYGAL